MLLCAVWPLAVFASTRDNTELLQLSNEEPRLAGVLMSSTPSDAKRHRKASHEKQHSRYQHHHRRHHNRHHNHSKKHHMKDHEAGLVEMAEPHHKKHMNCQRQWQNFHQPARTNMKARDFSRFNHGSNFNGLYVNTENNFAFCTIEKNAGSKWNAIFRKIETGNLSYNEPEYHITHESFSPKKAARVFQDPSSIRAVFVRDPLERFLSSFLDTCFGHDCKNSLCIVQRNESMLGQPITFKSAVLALKHADVAHIDEHWKLQAKSCELDQRIDEFNVIGVMKGDTFSQDATCLLDRARLSLFNTRGSKEGSRSFFNLDHFRDDNVAFLKKFYTPEAARAVYNKFKLDYETFGIAEPAWMEHATGELFHTTKYGCTERKSEEKTNALEEYETDDISILAERYGFHL